MTGLLDGAAPVLLALLALAQAGGCAAYAEMARPKYGRSWEAFAVQAGSAAQAVPHSSGALPPLGTELEREFYEIPQAREAVRKVEKILESESPSRAEIAQVMNDLDTVERRAGEWVRHDPRRLERLRAKIAEMRRRIEEKLLEVARIEPTFDVSSRKRVRVAVVKIGNGVGTIREAERKRWRDFLTRAGFSANPVFIQACLTGDEATAAAVRVAGARLGADAVLAYTTFAATTASPFGESAAVLTFAKCMFVDTRTEYLYFNAEGECHKKRVSLPFTVCARCLEEECLSGSVAALRAEILLELKRLSEEDG